MNAHNFIRSNPIETMKLLKAVRHREERQSPGEDEVSLKPHEKLQQTNSVQHQVLSKENELQMLKSTIDSKSQQQIKSEMSHKGVQIMNNMSSVYLVENKGPTQYDSNKEMNRDKSVENARFIKQLPENKQHISPQRYNKNIQSNANTECLNNQNFMGAENGIEEDSLERSQFLYQIKCRKVVKRYSEGLKKQNYTYSQKERQEQDIQENSGLEQRSHSPNLQNSITLQQGSNSQSKNSGSTQESSNMLSVSDFHYLLESNFKNTRKRVSNEQEQLLNQKSFNAVNNSSLLSNSKNYDWKNKLISTIQEKVNQTQQMNGIPLHKSQQNTLSPIVQKDQKCKTEGNSKRNSKEEELSNSILLQQQNKDMNKQLLKLDKNTMARISGNKPTLSETIYNNSKEIMPHERQPSANIFQEKINFFEVLKKFSDTFKKVPNRSLSSQPNSKKFQLRTIENQNNQSPLISKNQHTSISPLRNDKTQTFSFHHRTLTPSNQQKMDKLINTTLQPQDSQMNRGAYNSCLYYTRLSSTRKNKTRENSRKIQDWRYNEQVLSQQIKDQLYQDQLNKSVVTSNNNQSCSQVFSQKPQNKSIHILNLPNKTQQQEIEEACCVSPKISLELEPLQQCYTQNLDNFATEKCKINTFYTKFNQRKRKVTPMKNNSDSPIKNKTYQTNTIQKNDIAPNSIAITPFNHKMVTESDQQEQKKLPTFNISTPRLYTYNVPYQKQTLKQKKLPLNLQYTKESEFEPWEHSKRNSQLNDIDQYLNCMNKQGVIYG